MKKALFLFLLILSPLAVHAQCNVENFTDFESGTAGNVVTSGIMTASTHGYSTGAWAVQEDNNPGNIILSASANQPLTNPTGTLCGNSTSYPAGAGSLGVQFTGTGVAGTHSITYNLPSQFQLPQLQAGIWFCSDLPASDSSIPDIMGIESSSSDFAGVNFDGNGLPNGRFFRLETVNGYSPTGLSGQPPIYIPTGNCPLSPALGGDWLHLIVTLGQVNVAPSTLVVYNAVGGVVGTISVPASFIQNNGHATSTSIGCPANLTSSVTNGLHCFFDSWQIASTAVKLEPIGGPFCKAATAAAADAQTAYNACLSGGTVVLPFGAATWATQVGGTVTGSVNLQGQTQCVTGCAPGSAGVNLGFNDGVTTSMGTCNPSVATCITLANVGAPTIKMSGCSATNLCRMTGLTVSNTTSNSPLNGAVAFNGTHLQQSSRMDHVHGLNSVGTLVTGNEGQGLIDHILYYGPGAYSFSSFQGNFASGGYLNWEDPTNPGSQDAYFIEDSNFTLWVSGHSGSPSGLTDGNFGCKIVFRYSQLSDGNGAGITHGTDSGGFRSCVTVEIYNVNFTNTATSGPIFGSRGGITLVHDNVFGGVNQWQGIQQDYYREGLPNNPGVPSYGLARPGLQFSPSAAISNSNLNTLNPQAPAWIAGHVYATGALTNFGGSCNGSGGNYSGNAQATVGGTSGGSVPPCLVNGSTETDGGVTWIGIGGAATVPLGTNGTNAGFLTDNETPCTSGVNCTRYFDSPGHPYRDQPGTIHGQVVYGSAQWNNSGAKQPSNYWSTVSPVAVRLGSDFFNAQPAVYAPFAYPHFLQGGGPPPATPAASFNPTSINFGTLTIGNTSGSQTITITNTGTANLTFGPTGTTSPAGAAFSPLGTGTCPISGTLTPTSSCTVNIQATANSGSGVQNGTFNFPSNAGSLTVPLSVTVVSTVSITASLNFGIVVQATSSVSQNAVLTNGTGSTITITGATITPAIGTPTPDFTDTTTCTSTLAANTSCNYAVTFSPTAGIGVTEQATLTVTTSGGQVQTLLLGISGQINTPTAAPSFAGGTGDHTTCPAPVKASTRVCYASDGTVISCNGAAYIKGDTCGKMPSVQFN